MIHLVLIQKEHNGHQKFLKLDPNTFKDSTENGSGGSKTWDAINSWKNAYKRLCRKAL